MIQCSAKSTNPETRGFGYNTLAEELRENNCFAFSRIRQIQCVPRITGQIQSMDFCILSCQLFGDGGVNCGS